MLESATGHGEVVTIRASIEVTAAAEEKLLPGFRDSEPSEKRILRSDTKRSSWTVVSTSDTTSLTLSLESIIKEAKVKPAEAEKLRAIRSLQDLQTIVGDQAADVRKTRQATSRGKFQSTLVKINDFGKAYGTILESFKEAIPNGGGHAVWFLLGGLFVVADRKDSREKAISEFLSQLMHVMPRVDGYHELYPNTKMIEHHTKFHKLVIKALVHAFVYYRHKDWKGSFRRVSSVLAVHDKITDIFDGISDASRNIEAEAALQLHKKASQAYDQTKRIKAKAESAEIQLQQIKTQLSGVQEQLQAAEDANRDLRKKLNDIHVREIEDRKQDIKRSLVPIQYDPIAALESCQHQLKCNQKRRQELRRLLNGSTIQEWASTSKTPNFIWITDKKRLDSSISFISLETISRLKAEGNKPSLILHSVYQAGHSTSPLPQNARTATTMVKEAIYQTLLASPELCLTYDTMNTDADPFQSTPLSDLLTRLSHLFDMYSTTIDTPVPIYWIIDRIDTAFWATGKGLSDSPHRNNFSKTEARRVSHDAVKLDTFLRCFSDFMQGGKERKWTLKVLVTSFWDVGALGRAFGGDLDDEELVDGVGWVELGV